MPGLRAFRLRSSRRLRARARGPAAAIALTLLAGVAGATSLSGQLRPPQPRERRQPIAGPTRLPDGRPGPGYWQQQVDYRVEATLVPGTHRLIGTEWITYHNNSPDTLRELYWHLYQNIFRPVSEHGRHARIVGPVPQPTHGITVFGMQVEDTAVAVQVDRTLMRTPLLQPLFPGAQLHLRVEWEYEVPTTEADLRTGRDGADYGMAQWYPQIAVYDERGWDATPYIGQGEFYLEYGDWDVRLRVPADYVVAATGTLENPRAVLSAQEMARLAAASPDSVVHVIPAVEPRRFRRRAARATAVWHFAARRVRDFVWAASPTFLWDATRMHPPAPVGAGAAGVGPIGADPAGALVSAFYHSDERSHWAAAAALTRRTMELYAARLGAYPYPQVTAVSGPVTGMEYPMLVFGNPGNSFINEPARVLTHELGHQWFPMVVGSNENRYALMDEGFVTFMTALALENEFGHSALFSPRLAGWLRRLAPSGDERLLDQTIYLLAARSGQEISMLSPSDQIPAELYDVAAYMKPATVLYMLRDVLGRDTFLRALQAYYARWSYRHPEPDDFFNTVEDVAGRDLDWFWDEWFREDWKLDLALYDVTQTPGPAGWSAQLALANLGRAIMPATIRLTLADGSSRDVRVPETVWEGVDEYTLTVDSLPSRITTAVIDPELVLPDVNRRNNRWPGPKVVADFRPGLLMDMLPPLDAYRIGLSPSLGYTSPSGPQLGLSATWSYFGTDDRVSASFRIGTRDEGLDGELHYSDPLYSWGVGRSWSVDAFRVDGRIGASLGLSLAPGDWGGLITSSRADTRLRLGLEVIALEDSSYVPEPREWERGTLVTGSAALARTFEGSHGTARIAARLEGNGPASDWNYGKGQLEARGELPLPLGLRLFGRGIAGYASGRVPPQTMFNPAEASPLERFDSQLFRARGMLEALALADNARLGGGGGIPGANPDRLGTRLAAANLALQSGVVELFGDVGDAWRPRGPHGWVTDAGVGIGMDFDVGQGPIRLIHWGAHLRAPLWVNDPTDPGHAGWDLRWRVVFGGRWGD